jgi:hypothetical protein
LIELTRFFLPALPGLVDSVGKVQQKRLSKAVMANW